MIKVLRQGVLIILLIALGGGTCVFAQNERADHQKTLLPGTHMAPHSEKGLAQAATISTASFLTHPGDSESNATRPLDDAPDSTRKVHFPWAELVGIILLLGAGLFVFLEMKRLKR